jgi:hypothetical protein
VAIVEKQRSKRLTNLRPAGFIIDCQTGENFAFFSLALPDVLEISQAILV